MAAIADVENSTTVKVIALFITSLLSKMYAVRPRGHNVAGCIENLIPPELQSVKVAVQAAASR